MWSVARYDLGLTSEEFFRLTPRQFDALVKRKEYETQRDEFMLAQIAGYTINFSMCHPKEPVDPFDLMPSMAGKEKPSRQAQKQQRVRMTRQRRKQVTDQWRAGLAALRAVSARRGELRTKTNA